MTRARTRSDVFPGRPPLHHTRYLGQIHPNMTLLCMWSLHVQALRKSRMGMDSLTPRVARLAPHSRAHASCISDACRGMPTSLPLCPLPRGQHHQRRKEGRRKTSFLEEECGQIPTRFAFLHCVIGGKPIFTCNPPIRSPLSLWQSIMRQRSLR